MNLENTPEARDARRARLTEDTMAEALVERTFSVAEVGVLLALAMADWNIRDARECFEELGGLGGSFDRILARLTRDRIVKDHPRKRGQSQLDLLCEGLRLRYERLVAQMEDADGAANR